MLQEVSLSASEKSSKGTLLAAPVDIHATAKSAQQAEAVALVDGWEAEELTPAETQPADGPSPEVPTADEANAAEQPKHADDPDAKQAEETKSAEEPRPAVEGCAPDAKPAPTKEVETTAPDGEVKPEEPEDPKPEGEPKLAVETDLEGDAKAADAEAAEAPKPATWKQSLRKSMGWTQRKPSKDTNRNLTDEAGSLREPKLAVEACAPEKAVAEKVTPDEDTEERTTDMGPATREKVDTTPGDEVKPEDPKPAEAPELAMANNASKESKSAEGPKVEETEKQSKSARWKQSLQRSMGWTRRSLQSNQSQEVDPTKSNPAEELKLAVEEAKASEALTMESRQLPEGPTVQAVTEDTDAAQEANPTRAVIPRVELTPSVEAAAAEGNKLTDEPVLVDEAKTEMVAPAEVVSEEVKADLKDQEGMIEPAAPLLDAKAAEVAPAEVEGSAEEANADVEHQQGTTEAKPADDMRFDFGPGLFTKCSVCGVSTRNRGDEDTKTVYCRKCYRSSGTS